MSNITPMPRKNRLRRVVLLCCHFARNLAYYRIGRDEEHRKLFYRAKNASANFWRVANGNCIDMCVLEWCKLLGDKNGKHYWGKVVTDPLSFEAGLLRHLGMNDAAFQKEIEIIRHYRDKFLGHLDDDLTMNIPGLDVAKAAVWFYHGHIVSREAKAGELYGLAMDIDAGYRLSENEAKLVFEAAAKSTLQS